MVAVALACKASPSSAKPPAEKPAKDAAPGPKGKSPATKLDDAQITTFLAQAPAKSGTKRTVVREQAFAINKGQEDERWFVPALEERAGTVAYAHYEGKPGSAPRRFEDDSWPVDAVAAVAFDDVDVDGQRDVEVILSVHRLNAARFNVARIFRAGAGGALTLDWQLTDRANYGKPLPGMAEVRRRLAAKRDVALPAPPKEAAAGPVWKYRYSGNIDAQMIDCHGRATLAHPADAPACVVWTLTELHCVGDPVADGIHGEDDPDGASWHVRAERPGVGGYQLCKKGTEWTYEQDTLPGRSFCNIKVTQAASDPLPAQLGLECTWQCRPPSDCAGLGQYLFVRDNPPSHPSSK